MDTLIPYLGPIIMGAVLIVLLLGLLNMARGNLSLSFC